MKKNSIVKIVSFNTAIFTLIVSIFFCYLLFRKIKISYEDSLIKEIKSYISMASRYLLGYYYYQGNWIPLQVQQQYINSSENILYSYIVNNSGEIELGINGFNSEDIGQNKQSWEPEINFNLSHPFEIVFSPDKNANDIFSEKLSKISDKKITLIGAPIYCLFNNNYCAQLRVAIVYESIQKSVFHIKIFLIGICILLPFFVSLISYFFSRKFLLPIKEIFSRIRNIDNINDQPIFSGIKYNSLEVDYFRQSVDIFLKTHEQNLTLKQNLEVAKKLTDLARQVAHDIRSPLSALNMVASFAHELPEDKRRLVRSAVRSVTDIANQLASRNVEQVETGAHSQNHSPYLISSVVDSLVSEKRMQYRDRNGVSIDYEVKNDSHEVFSLINSTEFKRVLSNLVNNAVESFADGGEINVCVDSTDSEVIISVKDNGKGMPEEIKEKLFKEKISFGKSDGHGLGLTHAYNTVCGFGGKLELESTPGKGTTFSIVIPRTKPPVWFVSVLDFDGCKYLVVLDDDESIHQIWRERIAGHLKRIHLNSIQDFQKWLAENQDKLATSMFLIDYELLGTEKKGTDIIMESDLRKRAVLVTSYFEEQNVIAVCEKNGIRMLPKYLAGFTKLNGLIQNDGHKLYDYVLIDDKLIVRRTWEVGAKIANKKVATYSGVDEFMKDSEAINKDTFIYIDSDLGRGDRGEVLSEKIYDKGFKKIFLTTGFRKKDFDKIPWITDIVDKDPPFLRR